MQAEEFPRMDMHKSAASRVRHILQAMERSIDTARSRRTTAGGGGAVNAGLPRESTSETPVVPALANTNQSAAARLVMAAPAKPENRVDTMIGASTLIGGNPAIARQAPAPVDPSQPARLKARPKRFESTFAAQMAQNGQPAYRSQTG
jgi:hypothetical protein